MPSQPDMAIPTGVPSRPRDAEHHLPQLDGVRAAAILLVLVTHFLPSLMPRLPNGEIGVRVFFVLSGFLITGILMNVRRKADEVNQSIWISLKQFYIRRSLRIFPVYYLALAAAIVGGLVEYPDAIPWLITYTSNWYTGLYDRPFGPINHFWSLCVEEQFYLVWPLVVLCIAPRRLLVVSILVAIASIAFRLTATLMHVRIHSIYESTAGSFDAMAFGAILAQTFDRAHPFPLLRTWLSRLGWWVALPIIIACCALRFVRHETWFVAMFVGPVAITFFGFALIERCARGGRWLLARILEARPMLFIGKISYGLYVYHMVVYGLLAKIANAFGHQWSDLGPIRTPLAVVASFAVAIISWYAMEKPLNKLKSRFPYVLPKPTT